ncbi:MAG: hypothetical protein PHW86_03660 [Candidatus Bipolaricaulis sp.]|nr:hypothetical protein [Candidatus Bipolaricaulis sp.]
MTSGAATRETTEAPPRFDRLAVPLREQLGPALADLIEIRLDDAQLVGLHRVLGLRHAAGKGCKATARVLSLIYLNLFYGPRIVSVSDLARRAALSRPSVYKAIAYVAAPKVGRPKLIRLDPRATGPRRPGRWEIRPDILENVSLQRAQDKAASAASVNSNDSIESEKTTTKPQGQGPGFSGDSLSLMGSCAPRREAPSAETTAPKALLAWLDSPSLDLDRVPTFGERRKMAAALRICEDVDPEIASVTLDALFWRPSASLRVWRAAVLALVSSGDRFTRPAPPRRYPCGVVTVSTRPPEHWSRQSSTELAWRARVGLKVLCADPAAVAAFLAAVELGTLPEDSAPDAVQKHVERIEAQLRDIYAAAADRGKCPLCGTRIRLGPLPTPDDCRRLPGTFVFRVLRELKKGSRFPRDNWQLPGWESHTGPHLCAITLLTKRWELSQGLKGVRC